MVGGRYMRTVAVMPGADDGFNDLAVQQQLAHEQAPASIKSRRCRRHRRGQGGARP
jgi:hypothetical protein